MPGGKSKIPGGAILGEESVKGLTYKNTRLARMLKQRRLILSMTLMELAQRAEISPSHIGRIERGDRFPSARVLRKLAKPLQFKEVELFSMAEYLSSSVPNTIEDNKRHQQIDPYVERVLSQEPVEVQRMVVSMLVLMKGLSGNLVKDGHPIDKVLTGEISA